MVTFSNLSVVRHLAIFRPCTSKELALPQTEKASAFVYVPPISYTYAEILTPSVMV